MENILKKISKLKLKNYLKGLKLEIKLIDKISLTKDVMPIVKKKFQKY